MAAIIVAACNIRSFDSAGKHFTIHSKSNEDQPCITAYFRCSPAINNVTIFVLDITHFDVLTLRSSPFASLGFRCTIGLLAYTNTVLCVVIVIGFIVISTLRLDRGIIDGGDSSFCQCSKIFVAKPIRNFGVVFVFQYNVFTKESRDLRDQEFVCLSELSMSELCNLKLIV